MVQGGSSSGEGGVATEGPGGVPADSRPLFGSEVTGALFVVAQRHQLLFRVISCLCALLPMSVFIL